MEGGSRLWGGYHERERFVSGTDTGKWMFRLPVARSAAAMDLLYDAIFGGAIPAAKRSTPLLEERLGGEAILIAYVAGKSPAAAGAALARLRGYGLLGPAAFKDDMATVNGLDDIAYLDADLESGDPLAEGGAVAGSSVLRLDDGTHLEAWRTGHGPDGAPRGVGWRLQAWSRGGFLDEALWPDPEVRLPRRMHLMRIDFARIVRVIEPGAGSPAPGR